MALKGTLRDFSLADIFQLIGIQRKTGVLTLKSEKEVVTVSFADGNVVAADSLHRRLEDRLGTVLVKSGRISETQLQEALRIQKNTLKRMGNILVENGFIDSEGLKDALQTQISQMVYRLFRWRDGEYNFSQEERVEYDAEHVVPMSAESILMEGARILDEWPMIEKGIKSFSAVYRGASVEISSSSASPAAKGEEAARGVTLSEQERMIFGMVDGKRSVQEIVERSTLGEFETCRILYELIGRQLIEEIRTQAAKVLVEEAAPVSRRGASPLLVGLGYMVLILLTGALLVSRARPFIALSAAGDKLGIALGPLVRDEAIMDLRSSISRGRLQRVDFVIQVYYLLNRGYPADLRRLVTSHLLDPRGITDPWGRPYGYEVLPGGYRLTAPPSVGSTPGFEIDNTSAEARQ